LCRSQHRRVARVRLRLQRGERAVHARMEPVGDRSPAWAEVMDLGIRGRKAAVAASSAGLGFSTAAALHAEGVAVALCSRSKERVEAAAARLGDGAIALVADVATPDGAAAFIGDARDALGGL